MRIRIIGDLHGESWWKDVVKDIDTIDKCVFLGDYVDSFNVKDEDIINNLLEVIEFKKEHGDKVVLLYGNHEFNYLAPYTGYCSGFRWSAFVRIEEILRENKDLFELCHSVILNTGDVTSNILFSHAGFSTNWIRDNYYWLNNEHYEFLKYQLNEAEWEKFKSFVLPDFSTMINDSLQSRKLLDRVMQISYLRGGGSPSGGPLWADMRETYDRYLKTYEDNNGVYKVIQVVGHTALKHNKCKSFIDKDTGSAIHFCDLGNKLGDILLDIESDGTVCFDWSNDLHSHTTESYTIFGDKVVVKYDV